MSELPDTGYVDPAGAPYEGDGPAATFFLAPVAPNPATRAGAATLRFGLSRGGAVRLEAEGRRADRRLALVE